MTPLLIEISERVINDGDIHTLACDWLKYLSEYYRLTGEHWKRSYVNDHLTKRQNLTDTLLKNLFIFDP